MQVSNHNYRSSEGTSKLEKYADEVALDNRTNKSAIQIFRDYAITLLFVGGVPFLGMLLFTNLTLALKGLGIVCGGFLVIATISKVFSLNYPPKIESSEVARIQTIQKIGLVALSHPKVYTLEQGIKGVSVEDHTKERISVSFSRSKKRPIIMANGTEGQWEVRSPEQNKITLQDNTTITLQLVSGQRNVVALRRKIRKSDGTAQSLPTLYVRIDKIFADMRPSFCRPYYYNAYPSVWHEGFANDSQIKQKVLACASVYVEGDSKLSLPTEVGYNRQGVIVIRNNQYYQINYEGVKMNGGVSFSLGGRMFKVFSSGYTLVEDQFIWLKAAEAKEESHKELLRVRNRVNESIENIFPIGPTYEWPWPPLVTLIAEYSVLRSCDFWSKLKDDFVRFTAESGEDLPRALREE